MFDLEKHRREYLYDLMTEVKGYIPADLTKQLADRVQKLIDRGEVPLVQHKGLGTEGQLDYGGEYKHYIFKGDDIRRYLPELFGLYHGMRHFISAVASQPVITSPYPDSDVNIKGVFRESSGWFWGIIAAEACR
jgi:hypothetical protein